MCFSFNLGSALSSTQLREWFLLVGLFIFFSNTLLAQVTIQQFPRDHQLYQRDLSTNTANIPIEGIIDRAELYTSVAVKVYQSSSIFFQQSATLNFGRRRAQFSFTINLPAELTNFSIELYGVRDGQQVLIRRAEKIVAGDVILINGQSNAEALSSGKPIDYDEFSRSYTANFGWNYIKYSSPGLWGTRVAKNIITQQGIPVAIFNQAEGGKDIAYFLKQADNPSQSNYEKLRQRLRDAGVDKVTSIVWFQGEGDGWTTTIADYKSSFQQLQQAWQQDYQAQFTYILQIRYRSCSHTMPYPFEAQRQLAVEEPTVGIMSTTNLDHDGCHFPYENGYREMGDNLFYLMRRDIYGVDRGNVAAPDIYKITQVSDRELVLECNNTSSLSMVGTPWSDFRIENNNVSISNGLIEGNRIRLFLAGAVTNIQGVSYLAHTGSAADWIFNPNGIGLLQFYNFPVIPAPVSEVVETLPTPVNEEPLDRVEIETNLPTDCNAISVESGVNRLTLKGLTAPNVTVQVFDDTWSVVYRCIGADCAANTRVLDNLEAGSYYVKIQLLSRDWQLECFLEEIFIVEEVTDNTDCASIQINNTPDAIVVSGLKGAPVSSILVLSMDRNQQYFNCWGGGCGDVDAITIPIGTGTYRVVVKYYTAAFEEFCQQDQIVAVNSNLGATPIFGRQGYTDAHKQTTTRMDVYPTIAKEKIYINIQNAVNQVTNVQIWSQYGQIVQSIRMENLPQTAIDIQHLAKGIYFLNAPLKGGTNLTRKFIVK